MRTGQNPYTTDLTSLATSLHLTLLWKRAAYTPTFILCFEPLTRLSPLTAYWIWTGINVTLLMCVLWLLLRDLDWLDGLLLASLAIFYAPFTWHFQNEQAQILILLLLVLAMRWLRTGREAPAGIAVAVASLLRAFPLLLLGYLVVRRRWIALFYAAFGLLVGFAVTCAFLGISRSFAFFELVVPLSQQLKAPVAIFASGLDFPPILALERTS